MDVQFGPNSIDEPNLLYKLQHKIKVFNTNASLPNRGYNLVATSSKYGITFIASPDGSLLVFYLKDLINKESDSRHMSVKLPEKPTHILVNCDQELLAVTGGQLLCVYKVTDFQNQNVSPSMSIRSDVNPSTFVSALQWNPCVPDTIAMAFYDGTLLVSQVSSAQMKKVQSKARCICWSPKGKQLVTGNNDGTLSQYKPDLTPAKMITAPNLFGGSPVEALAIYWISTFQFAVVYKNVVDSKSRPAVTIVNTPKVGQPSCHNYEDICYSMGPNRPWYYYLQGIAQWNLILSSSSNSMEIATLGSSDGANWFQWCQPDEARPELPLTAKKQENYPVGICMCTCAIHQLPWGESDTLPYMPLLLVVSQSGLLTVFNVINLNRNAPQLCTPPQHFTLPTAAMTSDIPGEAPPPAPPVQIPAPVAQPKPQPVHQPAMPPQDPRPAFAPATQFNTTQMQAFNKPPVVDQSERSRGFGLAAVSQESERKAEAKPPTVVPQPQALVPQQKPQPLPSTKPQQTSQAQEVNAALKAEQERMNKMKADQELRSMLVKEVNDFQMELYKFVVKTRQVQIKLQHDLDSIDSTFNLHSLDTEQLRKQCSLEELRGAVVQLKLELVRACAVVAEARTHSEAKDLHQWTQTDPLTAKRMASVKKLAYYVQSQLEQAQRALDYKWNEMNRDSQYTKPGQRMIRPILDDVYQPLVKQQEIISRQQAVLRTLRSTLKECDATPMFKSVSLLRSTPFRNKDPLSKLTKNILNMSIEPQPNKEKDPLLSPQKLDALRDMLSNHRPVKIKPVNVELHQHLAAMRLNYEKCVKEKPVESPIKVSVRTEPVQLLIPPAHEQEIVKPIPKPDLIAKQPIIPKVLPFTPMNDIRPTIPGLANVARTLFSDEPRQEAFKPQKVIAVVAQQEQQPQQLQPTQLPLQPKPQQQQMPAQAPNKPQAFGFAPPTSITVTANTRSVLKDMLQNKQANAESKNDANTFMGQKICSPTASTFSAVPSAMAKQPTVSFTSKPISDINNMFSKFTPQTFAPETKPIPVTKPKSSETGEPETPDSNRYIAAKIKGENPLTNLFGMKTSTPLAANAQNVPDVLKSNSQSTIKPELKTIKSVEKVAEKLKEIVPDKSSENLSPVAVKKPANDDKQESTVFSATTCKPSIFASTAPSIVTTTSVTVLSKDDSQKPIEPKAEIKVETPTLTEKSNPSEISSASSIFAAANAAATPVSKPQPASVTPESPTPISHPTSIFGVSLPKPESPTLDKTTVSSSLFTSTTSSAGSIFGTSHQRSIFGTATTTTLSSASSVFGTSTTQSVFTSTASAQPTVFSTPTPASSTAFGAPAASIFAAATTQSSLFGSTTPPAFGSTPTTTQSVFGTATTTSQSIFGGAATTTQSIFGATTATTQSSLFGSSPTTTQTVFGTPASTTQSSIFGSPVSTQASVFGSPTPTTQSSVFGATTQASVFGAAAPSTQASIFGSPTQAAQTSVFGSPTPTTQTSVFGTAPATTAQNGSLFGGGEANLFAAASISTSSAPSPTSGGSIFGSGSTGSVFGSGNNNVFGGKAGFNQANSTAASIFGGGNAAFAQKPSNSFWSGSNASGGSGFGSGAFGQQATTQSSSIFGGGAATGGSFSSPSSGQPFGSPQQTSVFGSPQQQPASGFGGSAVFGNKPGFGQPTGFGSPTSGGGFGSSFGGFSKSPSSGFGAQATFGGGATFGGTGFGGNSPPKPFGGGNATPGFGSPTQSNSTFESLATQNTLTFGNLAQQSTQPAQQAPTFNTSPSFTGWRG